MPEKNITPIIMTDSIEYHLSSSSAWSIGSIALRAAIFSSLSALHAKFQSMKLRLMNLKANITWM
jgi:hypothetical protein